MEKRLNTKIDTYMVEFKDKIRNKINTLTFTEQHKINELLEYVYDYDRFTLKKDDLNKRVRIKNEIPNNNRCNAKRCNGEQCTRRRKTDSTLCGTHMKGIPHGLINSDVKDNTVLQKVELVAREIGGITYYLDNFNNVYKTEDILEDKQNPAIIAKYKIESDGTYSIPDFGI